jgi:hypothetical protein
MSDRDLQDAARRLFGTDAVDFGYITEELLASDAKLGPETEVSAGAGTVYGNNARYGARVINGETCQVYVFEYGGNYTNPGDACGTSYTAWARQDIWHHTYLGDCPSGREKWSFSK